MIDFDTETRGLQWYADIGEPFTFMTQWVGPGNLGGAELAYSPHDEGDIVRWLSNTDEGYRAWNSKFDLHALRVDGYELPDERQWHDGMVAAHIIDERRSVALQAVGDTMFAAEAGADTEEAVKTWLAKETRRRQSESRKEGTEFVRPNYSHVPAEIMEPYAAHDPELQRRIMDVIWPRIEENEDYKALYELEMRVLPALFQAEVRGIPFDRPALVALEGDLLPKLDELEEKCIALAEFDNFNPRSPKQVGEALDRLDADTRYMTRDAETKQLIVDEENLNACTHPLAEHVLQYRGQHKMFAMLRRILHGEPGHPKFPHPYLTGEDRVHPNFRQVGARTGRMSCSNPNFQQIHRDDLRLRYCVKAEPGHKLVCVDLEGIELRLLAAYAGEGAMLDLIRSGEDPHQHTADMLGMPGRTRSTGAHESPRDQGKRMNYLKNYGGGLRAMRKFFLVGMDEARSYRNRYEEAYPEVKRLEDRIEMALWDKGYIRTPWGRRHRVKSHVGREAYMFTAYLLQGTAGDLFKDASATVHGQGVPLIGFVHDELIAHVPTEDAEEAGHIMVKALTEHPEITRKVPLEAEAKIVDRWSDAKKQGWTPDYERST